MPTGYNYASKSSSSDQVYYEIDEKDRTSDEEAPKRPEINVITLRARKKKNTVSLAINEISYQHFAYLASYPGHMVGEKVSYHGMR